MSSKAPSGSFFNAHHSPIGAFASLTLGFPGPSGGLGLELGGPPKESVFIGLENPSGKGFKALPFFGSSADSEKRYDVAADAPLQQGLVRPFPKNRIRRKFSIGTDTWQVDDLTFSIFSPPKSVADPATASLKSLRESLVPAVFAEMRVDNTSCNRPRRVFFGFEGSNPYYNTRRLDDVSGGRFTGVGQGPVTALVSNTPGVYSGCAFTLDKCLRPDFPENLTSGLGSVGALMADIPAGEIRTLRFAICFYRSGIVTSGLPMRYYYTRLFDSIEAVASYALENWQTQKRLALRADADLTKANLTEDQAFHVSHAVRSYSGATEFLMTDDGHPFWSVNEGEYRMLNTFDLTVDHLFYELDRNPWVVRNQLDWFTKRYSYRDKVRLPGDPKGYPGGISFAHDMGIGNCLSRPGHSAYEQFGLHGCFSHMTHEQLVNWVCCAASYLQTTGDQRWLESNRKILRDCLRSLVNRDHPDPSQRDGVMSADSSRCLGGSEITTYDSLDVSLGQARNNLYLAVKTWAAYLALGRIFHAQRDAQLERLADRQARLCSRTICSHMHPEGFIPAVMGEGNESRIIPAIEGLVFPLVWNMRKDIESDPDFSALLSSLKKHLRTVLVPGVCRFRDGGWKLSSTNDNSWLSKIYLCQFVARSLFSSGPDPAADAAHRAWLLDPENAFFAWSDQMVAGKARGSKYYPRGVTSWLWLSEPPARKPRRRKTPTEP